VPAGLCFAERPFFEAARAGVLCVAARGVFAFFMAVSSGGTAPSPGAANYSIGEVPRKSASLRNALALWLYRFFSSADISANDLAAGPKKKTGS